MRRIAGWMTAEGHRRAMRRIQVGSILVAAILLLGAATTAAAPPHVALHMSFHPNRPGSSTTISFGFTIARPSPVRAIRLRLPAGMGFATATLGFATCNPARFKLEGARACPANSRVGRGTAYAEAPFVEEGKPDHIFETARITIYFGPIEGPAQLVLFWIEGRSPATYSQAIVARALPAKPPHGESLIMEVPLFAATAIGPYVDLRGFKAKIGPEHLTYYLHEHGRAIPFKPHGVTVPEHCPPGGYPVDATFTWWEETEASRASTRVPCARRPGQSGRAGHRASRAGRRAGRPVRRAGKAGR